jgi:hypothetical protein
MKHRYTLLVGITLCLSTLSRAQSPRVLRPDLSIRKVHEIGNVNLQVRLVYDASRRVFFSINRNGDLHLLRPDGAGGFRGQVVSRASDHALDYLQGVVVREGVVYLCGNHVTQQDVSGYGAVRKGTERPDGTWAWTTVLKTAEHASSRTLYDHGFSGICFSPDGRDLYVSSGSRTDHGEIKDQNGKYSGLREEPLTAAIFKVPAATENLLLPNDSAGLAPYVVVRGVRNAFGIAFSPQGDLFSVENAGDRDDPEEMNWIRPGRHYGFPWEIGGNATPMQFAGYDPAQDKLVNKNGWPGRSGGFYNDPAYPKKPTNLTYQTPIRNYGPDADKYRDPQTGAIRDASDEGGSLTTFTSHRSPVGLVFDVAGALGGEYAGQGFTLSYQKGTEDASGLNSKGETGPMNDPSEDLLLLKLTKTADEYRLNSYRVAGDFSEPVDAELVGTRLYVLETRGAIYEITFPERSQVVLPPPVITQAGPARFCPGDSVVLTASAGYDGYQWQRSDTTLAETSARLVVRAGGTYRVAGRKDGQLSPASVPVVLTAVPGPDKPMISLVGTALQSSSATGNQWLLNGVPVSGATASTFTPTQGGTVQVRVTQEGCSAVSEPFDFVTGLEPAAVAYRLFPNPTDGVLRLEWPWETMAQLTLLDAAGRRLHSTRQLLSPQVPAELDLRRWPSGLYLLRVETEQRQAVLKVVRR